MRLLVDTPIPASVTALSTPEFALERWEGGSVADAEFLRRAADLGYAGVVFLGKESLSRPDVLEAAAENSIGLIVITVKDPIRAHDAIAQHMSRLQEEVGPARVVIASAHAFDSFPLADVQSELLGGEEEASA